LRAMEQPSQPPPTTDAPFPDLIPPAPPRPEAAAAAPARAAKPAAGGEEEDIFDLGPPARVSRPVAVPLADEPFADLWTPPAPEAPAPAVSAAAPAAAPAAVAVAELEEEPEPEDVIFPGLASRESRSRYLRALAAEGLFAFDLTAAAAVAPAPPPAPVAAAPAVLEPEPFPAVEPEPMAFHAESAAEVAEPLPAPPSLEDTAPALEAPALEEPFLEEPPVAVAGFSWEVVEEPAPVAAPMPVAEPEPEAPVFEIE